MGKRWISISSKSNSAIHRKFFCEKSVIDNVGLKDSKQGNNLSNVGQCNRNLLTFRNTLKWFAAISSKTFLNLYQITWRNVKECGIIYRFSHDNLRFDSEQNYVRLAAGRERLGARCYLNHGTDSSYWMTWSKRECAGIWKRMYYVALCGGLDLKGPASLLQVRPRS